jgi:aminopeptidase N
MTTRWSLWTAILLSAFLALSPVACAHGGTYEPHRAPPPTLAPAPDAGLLEHAGCSAARAAGLRHWAARQVDEDDPGLEVMREAFDDTDVLHYNLDIEVFPDSEQIAGTNRITSKSLTDGLTEFTFRLHTDLTITAALINETTPVAIEEISTTTRRVTLDRAYDAGEVFTLSITYEGSPPTGGFGYGMFQKHGGVDVVATFSCPYYAYTWWPCKDGDKGEPGDNADKATIELAVTAPDNLRTVSNGVLQGIDELDGNRQRYRWATNYPIATYLIMFSSSNYITWTVPYEHADGTMPVEFNIYPESDSDKVRQRLGTIPTILGVFGELYGPYPFINEKYGVYEFQFGGGMEHQTNTGQGVFNVWLCAHELSHQWWGDAITCRTWHDTWLNEGFATYSEALWKEFRPASPGQSALHDWMATRRPSRVDGSVYCYDTGSAGVIFDYNFRYCKAAWVLHQLRHIVGDDTFFAILRAYRAAFEGNAATTEEYIAIASAVHGQDLSWFFQPWIYEIGAPAYRFGWEGESINGQRYLRLYIKQVQDASWPTFNMPLDVRVDSDGGSETHVVFNDARAEHFVLAIPESVTNVMLDEFNWVLHTSLGRRASPPASRRDGRAERRPHGDHDHVQRARGRFGR